MEGSIAGGIVGIIFLVISIGFISFAQPAPHAASEHPFLNPQVASAENAVYLNDRGTLSVRRR